MRDPHVVSLQYKLGTSATVTFKDPPVIKDETETFLLTLENGTATVELKDHFASVEAARMVVDNYLRSWELDVLLHSVRPQEIKFTFQDAKVIDRDPPPPGASTVLQASTGFYKTTFGTATLFVTRRKYPAPPKHFRVNQDVEILWNRFDNYNQGHETLLSMAYFCLTLLERRTGKHKGKRTAAAEKYKIDKPVLDKLGDCTVPQKLDTKIMFLVERVGLNYLFARAIGLDTPRV